VPAQGQPLAGALDGHEVGGHGRVLDSELERRAEPEGVWAGGGGDPVRHELDPRLDRRVVGPDAQVHPHRHPSAQPLDDAHQARRPAGSPRHEVDQADGAVGGLELGLEHQRPRAVAAAGLAHLARGCHAPVSVPLVAEQRGEARGRIEARQAEPVDRSVPADQRRRLHVADQAIVLDEHPPTILSAGVTSHHLARVIRPTARRHSLTRRRPLHGCRVTTVGYGDVVRGTPSAG
jgi:hypothetical protein